MYARVKEDCPFNAVTACGGLVFTKVVFAPVPAHEEAGAKDNPYLETVDTLPKEKGKAAKKPEPAPAPAIANQDKTVRLINRRNNGIVDEAPPADDQPEEE